jgi:hypothetical protein
MDNKYDSTNDILIHQRGVSGWMNWVIDCLTFRTVHHDESKLNDPEKQMFDIYTPLLKIYEFGSEEYKDALKKMGDGLEHHYQNNPHHPEHYQDGIDGMSIWDVVEMICDWMAASVTKGESVNLDYLQERFNISPQLRHIIENTLWSADMDNINYRLPFPFEDTQINNLLPPETNY